MAHGKDKLDSAVKALFETKQDVRILVPAILGRYNEVGNKEVEVPGRPNFVYVRVRGRTEEIWRVFNDKVGMEFGIPVLLEPDPTNLRQYRIHSRDSGKYQVWIDAQSQIPKHGDTHAFSTTTPQDPVWVYRRQLVQPLLCRPQAAPNMTVYVEPDYYFWGNEFKYYSGGSSVDLSVYKPASSGQARYITVYLIGQTGTLGVVQGDVFSSVYPPADRVPYIPEVDLSVGIPLAAIYLTSTTAMIRWSDIYDMRVLLYTPPTGTMAGTHALDPAYGPHTGSLPAVDVSVADPTGIFTATEVEDVLSELYTAAHVLPLASLYDIPFGNATGSYDIDDAFSFQPVIDTLRIGQKTSPKDFGAQGRIQLTGEGSAAVRAAVYAVSATSTAAVGPTVTISRCRGTLASPSAVNASDFLGSFGFGAYDGTAWGFNARFEGYASEAWTAIAHGERVSVRTTPTGSISSREVARFEYDGEFYRRTDSVSQKYLYEISPNIVGGFVGYHQLTVVGSGTILLAGGSIQCSTFGCNGATPQTAYASGGALAAYATGAFGLDSDANMSALHALVVKIRAALVANGIMS